MDRSHTQPSSRTQKLRRTYKGYELTDCGNDIPSMIAMIDLAENRRSSDFPCLEGEIRMAGAVLAYMLRGAATEAWEDPEALGPCQQFLSIHEDLQPSIPGRDLRAVEDVVGWDKCVDEDVDPYPANDAENGNCLHLWCELLDIKDVAGFSERVLDLIDLIAAKSLKSIKSRRRKKAAYLAKHEAERQAKAERKNRARRAMSRMPYLFATLPILRLQDRLTARKRARIETGSNDNQLNFFMSA